MRTLLLAFILLVCTLTAMGQQYFYSTGTNSSPTTLSNWNSARNGTGSAPANFTANGQVFVIQDGHVVSRTSGGWTISGTGSYLLVEGGGTYTNTSSTGATLTITLAGTASKIATWNQTNGYAAVTISGGNKHSKLNLFSPSNFRFDKSYPGSVHIRGNTASTFFGSATGLDVGGDFILGTNATFIGANTTSHVTHRIGGSFNHLLAMDYQFLGGVGSLFSKEPSNKAIELCEDSIVETVNMTAFEALCQDNIELERLARKMTAFAFLFCQKTIEDIRFRSAKERYLDLTTMYPGIENRIPLKHLASYLGISQVSLSRIRGGKQ